MESSPGHSATFKVSNIIHAIQSSLQPVVGYLGGGCGGDDGCGGEGFGYGGAGGNFISEEHLPLLKTGWGHDLSGPQSIQSSGPEPQLLGVPLNPD